MKKFLLTAIAALLGAVNADAQKVLVKEISYTYIVWNRDKGEYEESEEPAKYDDDVDYFYGTDMRQISKLKASAQSFFQYNADNTVAREEVYIQSQQAGPKLFRYINYKYDDKKNVIDVLDVTNDINIKGVKYEEYDDQGYYTVRKTYSDLEGRTINTEVHFKNTYNENKQLTTREELKQDVFDKTKYKSSKKQEYTYDEKGDSVQVVYYEYTSGKYNEVSTIKYEYDNEHNIVRRVTTNTETGRSVYFDYTYAALDAAKAVKTNVIMAMPGTINQVYVQWTAVEGAEGYTVLYDNVMAETTKTDYLTPSLLNGQHTIAVCAIVNGVNQPIAELKKIDVMDETIKPCTNFRILSMELEQTSDNPLLNVSFAWDAPDTENPVNKYIVYIDHNDPTWIPKQDITANEGEELPTEKTLSFSQASFQDKDKDDNPLPSGPDCKIWITAVYSTGESAPSEVLTLNIYNEIQKLIGTGVDSVESETEEGENATVYSLGGIKLQNTKAARLVIKGNRVYRN